MFCGLTKKPARRTTATAVAIATTTPPAWRGIQDVGRLADSGTSEAEGGTLVALFDMTVQLLPKVDFPARRVVFKLSL